VPLFPNSTRSIVESVLLKTFIFPLFSLLLLELLRSLVSFRAVLLHHSLLWGLKYESDVGYPGTDKADEDKVLEGEIFLSSGLP
jgi:hypothetical protein